MAPNGGHALRIRLNTAPNHKKTEAHGQIMVKSKVLTLFRRKKVVLVTGFEVQNVLNLVINLLGFRLFNKNVAIVRLQKREGNLANS